MASQGLSLEAFHQPGEAIAFGIDIGIVDLVGIACDYDFSAFSNPGHNRFDFMGCKILGLIDHHVLTGNRTTADITNCLHFEEAHTLEIGPAVAGVTLIRAGA